MADLKDACARPSLTPVEEALAQILAATTPVTETETVSLDASYGRVLAAAVISPVNVPPQDNSAMDGYSICEADVKEYALVGQAFAGHPFTGDLNAGQCVRIMTGAPVPAGATTVVMQENADVTETPSGKVVSFSQALNPGDNIRRAGEDIKTGSEVLSAGRRLTPADCGLLASIGIPTVEVLRPIRVALLTTGDELVAPGQTLEDGQIYESNSFVLRPILQRLGAEITVLTAVEDNTDTIKAELASAADSHDVIITSGGVSVGEADYTRIAVEALGRLDLWKMAMKPGKPLAFGRIGDCLFLGLPGNPVSSLVTLHQVGLPMLRTLAGESVSPPLRIPAVASVLLRKRPGRTDYQRGIAALNTGGQLEVRSTGQQGSGILSSVSRANCFIVLEQDRGRVEAGETVMVELFDQWLC
ncbi:MAG: gephyrin-like molybdotransferase Glp [Thalassolituus sp.]